MLQKYTQKRSGVFQGCKTIMSYLIFEIQYDNIALLQILKKTNTAVILSILKNKD